MVQSDPKGLIPTLFTEVRNRATNLRSPAILTLKCARTPTADGCGFRHRRGRARVHQVGQDRVRHRDLNSSITYACVYVECRVNLSSMRIITDCDCD